MGKNSRKWVDEESANGPSQSSTAQSMPTASSSVAARKAQCTFQKMEDSRHRRGRIHNEEKD